LSVVHAMDTTQRPWGVLGPVVAIAVAVVVAELAFGLRYPLFRDELYYLACARHLALGYVDHPPLSIWVLAAWRAVFGDSALALRVPPALAAGALVVLTSRLASQLKGGRFATIAAAVLAGVTPGYLGGCGIYSMNAFDLVFWALALLLVSRLAEGADAREWLWLGVVVGLGLLNKWSLLFFLAGLGVALLVTPMRSQLRRWQLWAGLGLVGLINLPHVWWQVTHGWPTLEFMANATRYKNAAISVGDFAVGQIFELGPASFPVWLAGLALLLAARGGRARPLGVI
jgi:4-amino-4-deoxy-L-arabinose transferase-like glycosyltransferase